MSFSLDIAVRHQPLAGLAVALMVVLSGCGGSRASAPTPVPTGTCTLTEAPDSVPATLTVVFTEAVSADHAPRPTTSAERFVFAHAYESLLRIDCKGALTGSLARSWALLDGSTRVRVVLRSDARFANGDVVTAGDVIASWRATGLAPTAVLARHLADHTTAVDDTTLDIELGDLSVAALGQPELAVAKRTSQSRWLAGTGRYRVRDAGERRAGAGQRSTFVLEPLGSGTDPALTVHTTTEFDARDLVDAGTDVLITDDRALSAYGAARSGVASSLLESPQTWLLVTHAPATGDSGAALDPSRTATVRTTLARDVVRAHARPAGSARWSPDAHGCSAIAAPPPVARSSRRSSRVVYRRDEPVARALAERLVALAASGDAQLALLAPGLIDAGARAAAVGLAPDEFDTALRAGGDLASLVPVQHRPTLPCLELERLLAAAPWLVGQSRQPGASIATGIVAPLIETRSVAVVRKDRVGLTLTGDGSVVVSPARRTGSADTP